MKRLFSENEIQKDCIKFHCNKSSVERKSVLYRLQSLYKIWFQIFNYSCSCFNNFFCKFLLSFSLIFKKLKYQIKKLNQLIIQFSFLILQAPTTQDTEIQTFGKGLKFLSFFLVSNLADKDSRLIDWLPQTNPSDYIWSHQDNNSKIKYSLKLNQ